jgi:hypothetical protein
MVGADDKPNGTFFISRPDSDRVGNGGVRSPYGDHGEWLWVKETHRIRSRPIRSRQAGLAEHHFRADVEYRADGETRVLDAHMENWRLPFEEGRKAWRPSIFLPRWASRITLDVVEVRVERLVEISIADAIAEGVERDPAHPGCWKADGDWICGDPKDAFRRLWDSINGDRASWASNPWVWVITFKRAAAVAHAA